MKTHLDRRQIPYPANIIHKRFRVLTLNKEDYIKTKITSLTEEQLQGIEYIINIKDKLNSWEESKLKNLHKNLNNNNLRYNLKSKTIIIGRLKIKLDNIILLGKSGKCTLEISKYIKYKIIRENKYWYNYGGNFYDYYGVGLQEVNAAWTTI